MPQTFQAHCSCGKVVFEGRGEPMARIACYCDDCQAVNAQIDAMPNGKSGMRADGGTVSSLFRKDLVRCVKGSELVKNHKLRPDSPATRVIATCCNSNMLTTFENWLPMTAMRTHSVNVESVQPEMCINTKWAPDKSKITFPVMKAAKIPPQLGLRVVANKLQLMLSGSMASGI